MFLAMVNIGKIKNLFYDFILTVYASADKPAVLNRGHITRMTYHCQIIL